MAILQECPLCHRKQGIKNKRCACGINLDKEKKSRKVKFWVNYRLPNGKQKRELVAGEGFDSCSIEDARVFHSKRIVQKAEGQILDIKIENRMTFQELTDWYLDLEKVKALSSYWRIKLSLKQFNSVFGDMMISRIEAVDLENYQMARRREGKADATIDQETGAAKTMIMKAFNNRKIDGEPLRVFKAVKKLLKGNANARDRILSKDEFERLMDNASPHLKPIIAMGYYTGMREGEITHLKWNRIDLRNRVINLLPEDTKDNEKRTIPISNELYKILMAGTTPLREAREDKHVFLYKRKPIMNFYNGLRRACKKAGIVYGRFEAGGFTFHDLRHTFNTNMRKAGIQESVIMAITGHSTRSMFDRYNTVDEDDIRNAVDQFQTFLQDVDQTVDQNEEAAN